MIHYRGYLRPHLGFILDAFRGGAPTFVIARALYVQGVRSTGSPSPKAQVTALNILIRHILGRKVTKKSVLVKRIAAKKAQIAALKVRLDELRAEKRALGGM